MLDNRMLKKVLPRNPLIFLRYEKPLQKIETKCRNFDSIILQFDLFHGKTPPKLLLNSLLLLPIQAMLPWFPSNEHFQ